MLIGFFCVVEKVFKCVGMLVFDIDLYEFNEVFVLVVLCFMEVLVVLYDCINVNGGVIVMGYLFGVMGVMIFGMLFDELEWCGVSMGLVMLCVGVGMGIVIIIECV